MKKFSLIFVMLAVLVLAISVPTQADAPSPAQVRLEQEPWLACIAADLGVPAELAATAKLRFDTRYGAANKIVTADQWGATHADRAHLFAAWVGTPNVTDDGGGANKRCARLLDAQKRLLGE